MDDILGRLVHILCVQRTCMIWIYGYPRQERNKFEIVMLPTVVVHLVSNTGAFAGLNVGE
jgi:hypothetical protein